MRDIVNTPCHLRMVHIGPSKGPEDENGSRPSATHDRVDLLLRGDSADPAPAWLEDLFPGINETLQLIAGSEGHPGEVIQSKRQVGDQHMTLLRSDGKVAFEMHPAYVSNNKPSLNIDDKGGWRLPLSFVGLLTDRAEITIKQIGDYTDGADLTLNCGSLNPELPLDDGAEPPAGKQTKTRKKAAPAQVEAHA